MKSNPGYGHPMRPEYILSTEGMAIGEFCASIAEEGQRRDIRELLQGKWTCPAIIRTGKERLRFNELKRRLPPVTSRALSLTLKDLLEAECMQAKLLAGHPPAHQYGLSRKVRGIYRIYTEHRELIEGKQLI